MIRVTIDVIPFGNESRRETKETIDIINNLSTGNSVMGNYDYTASGLVNKVGQVNGFHRKFGLVNLIYKVMKEMVK